MNALTRTHWIARASLAFMFAWHGLVPKLLWLSPTERSMIAAHGIGPVERVAQVAGVAELILALWLLLMPRSALPLLVAALVLLGLLIDVALINPQMLFDAFNPVTLNVAGMALCAVAWSTMPPMNRAQTARPASTPR